MIAHANTVATGKLGCLGAPVCRSASPTMRTPVTLRVFDF